MQLQEGQAVLRQPHHLRRQHDDARQRHPARDAAARGRRVQHRGAEVQRQAAQPARLLQAARGVRRQPEGREDAGREEQGRRHAEVRGAEPQPAHASAPACRSSRASSASCRSRRRTSSAAARARRSPCSPAARAKNYQLAFTEPFLFDRPITGGHRPVQARARVLLRLHAEVDRRQRRDRLPGDGLHPRCSSTTASSGCT